MALLCLMWCLWNERNARSFEDGASSLLNLKKLVIKTLYTWRVTLTTLSDCTFSDFLDLFLSLWFRGLLYTSCVLWVALLCTFLKYTYKNKKDLSCISEMFC
jgi:hypothetical protein